jgi:hypothetical protein
MPFVTFTIRRGLSAADKSRLSEAGGRRLSPSQPLSPLL